MSSASENVIFYTISTQYENLGDLIIIKNLLRELRKRGRLIIEDQGVPEWFCQELEITSEERVSQYGIKFDCLIILFALVKLFHRHRNTYLVLTPGHKFDAHKELKLKNLLSLTLDLFLFRTVGTRICRFGVSIGPFTPLSEVMERWRARFMYFYSVRDSISEDYARKLGITKVERFPDLAWLTEVESLTNVQTQTRLEDDFIIFSFREASHKLDDPTSYRERLYPVLDAIVELMCGKFAKKLVVSYQVEFDYEVCREIRDRYKENYETIFLEDMIGEKDTQLYSRASLVFSNRLHVLLFAMAHGAIPVPVIDVKKHDKITGIFTDAGLMHLVTDIQDTQFNTQALLEIITNASQIREKIKLLFNENKSSGNAILNRIMS